MKAIAYFLFANSLIGVRSIAQAQESDSARQTFMVAQVVIQKQSAVDLGPATHQFSTPGPIGESECTECR